MKQEPLRVATLVAIEHQYLGVKSKDSSKQIIDVRIAAGLMLENFFEHACRRCGFYMGWGQPSVIQLIGPHTGEIPVSSRCFIELQKENVLAGPLEKGQPVVFTSEGKKLIKSEWFLPWMEELLFPELLLMPDPTQYTSFG